MRRRTVEFGVHITYTGRNLFLSLENVFLGDAAEDEKIVFIRLVLANIQNPIGDPKNPQILAIETP